jgi:hypothetical protein
MLLRSIAIAVVLCTSAFGQTDPEGSRLGSKTITQEQIASQELSLDEIRAAGLRIFATPFNKLDGYGDGPMDPSDPTTPGGRPTLQNNGTFLRVNGLDGQTCVECHFMRSNARVPLSFGIGGFAGSVSNVMFLPTTIDVDDTDNNGFANYNGRFINPPFLFGSGGVELLAKEMTEDLQGLKAKARGNAGTEVALITKGVSFGKLRYKDKAQRFDYSAIEGIDPDLVVKPFGRKGEFATIRAFDREALLFHFGMQPTEVVGDGEDGDGDGVVNEITVGELSALSIFNTSLDPPEQHPAKRAGRRGRVLFETMGCAVCHVPEMATRRTLLPLSFPEIHEDPSANLFYELDLAGAPVKFRKAPDGGVIVPLFADLKRHDMGPELAESFGSDLDAHFTTARLWGVADTAPYLHDGRALTLTDAILMHGGEAAAARDAFAALSDGERSRVIAFLMTLRTPSSLSIPNL